MKVLLSIVLVISALGYLGNAEDIDTRETIQDTIDDLIKQVKDEIKDTISIDDQTITLIQNEIIFAAVSLSNNAITGLKDFNIDVAYEGLVVPLPSGFTFTLPSVNLHLNTISVLEFLNSSTLLIETDGSTDVTLTDFKVEGNIAFSVLPVMLEISSLKCSFGDLKFDIVGLFTPEISDFLSTVLTDVVLPVARNLEPTITSIIQDAINAAIADALSSGTQKLAENNVKNYNEEEYATEALKIAFDSLSNKISLKTQKKL